MSAIRIQCVQCDEAELDQAKVIDHAAQTNKWCHLRSRVLVCFDGIRAHFAIGGVSVIDLQSLYPGVTRHEMDVADANIVVQDVHLVDSVIQIDRARVPFGEIWGYDLVKSLDVTSVTTLGKTQLDPGQLVIYFHISVDLDGRHLHARLVHAHEHGEITDEVYVLSASIVLLLISCQLHNEEALVGQPS